MEPERPLTKHHPIAEMIPCLSLFLSLRLPKAQDSKIGACHLTASTRSPVWLMMMMMVMMLPLRVVLFPHLSYLCLLPLGPPGAPLVLAGPPLPLLNIKGSLAIIKHVFSQPVC